MDLSKLNLHPGLAMQVEIKNETGEKLPSKLLGFFPGRSVMITTPVKDGRPILVRLDQALTVRFFSHNHACAFQSTIRHICTTPYPYLHLRYPTAIESGEVRASTRVKARIKVQVANKTNPGYQKTFGLITDLSTTGAKLETLAPVADIGDQLVMNAKVVVDHVSRVVSWPITVKSEIDRFDSNNAVAAYGTVFDTLADLDYLALFAYVNGQIAKGATS